MENGILIEHTPPIATVTINNPLRYNSINREMWARLHEIFSKEMPKDLDTRVIVLRGAGNKAFSAGADIRELRRELSTPEKVADVWNLLGDVNSAIETCPQSVIAMIRGMVLGAACGLALACDFRVAAEDAEIGVPAIKLGITLGMADTARLVLSAGWTYSKEILIKGERFNIRQAQERRLLTAVYSNEALEEETYKLAEELAIQPPLVVREIKMNHHKLRENMCGNHQPAHIPLWGGSSDSQEGLSAFEERRTPTFLGH